MGLRASALTLAKFFTRALARVWELPGFFWGLPGFGEEPELLGALCRSCAPGGDKTGCWSLGGCTPEAALPGLNSSALLEGGEGTALLGGEERAGLPAPSGAGTGQPRYRGRHAGSCASGTERLRALGRGLICWLGGMGLVMMSGCGGGKGDGGNVGVGGGNDGDGGNVMKEARLLRMSEGEGYVRVEVVNPWDTTRMLGRYLLVERGAERGAGLGAGRGAGRGAKPDSLPEGYVRIDVPLERALVYSAVHGGAIAELGETGRIAGVADGEYFTKEPLAGRIKRGEVRNVGSSMAPSVEAIVALGPDAILLSPFENAGHGTVGQAGVPIVECADYMESTPKGRAEWIKLLGVLFGERERADSIYGAVSAAYDSIAASVPPEGKRPVVLTEQLRDGYWFVPGGDSYMARMIMDAGGVYPWANDGNTGSLQLDFSSVYAKAGDADVWLIKSFGHDTTLEDLRNEYLLNSQFKAFKQGNVWVANTAEVPLYDEFPFHPELLLEEYARIFRGEGNGLRYYRKAR